MFLPISLYVEQRLCTVVGAGRVAERKCRVLHDHGALIRVVASRIARERFSLSERVELIEQPYDHKYLDRSFLVFAATNDAEVNRQIVFDARGMGILSQRADLPDDSDFILPATLRRGRFTASFGTDGHFPALSARLRRETEPFFGQEYDELCGIAEALEREEEWQSFTPAERQSALRQLADSSALDCLRRGNQEAAWEQARLTLSQRSDPVSNIGRVFLVGAGPGDPGLLTVKGAECLRCATVVIHDALINAELLDMYCADAERVDVGKRKGRPQHMQPEINAMLVDWARKGHTVVRLKGGDPTIFGRCGEEARALAAANIPFEIVPGVSSVAAVPAYAGIPITDREYHASSFGVYSLHLRDGQHLSDEQWRRMAEGPDTLVLLMGISALAEAVENLLRYGRPGDTPMAILLEGTTPRQQRIVATLDTMLAKIKNVTLHGPGLIVVGNAVAAAPQMQWRRWESIAL